MILKKRVFTAVVLLISLVAFAAFGDDAMRKLVNDRKFDAAVKHGEAIAADARSVDVWLLLGTSYENMRGDGNAAKARAAYEGALKANPSHQGAHLALGAFEFRAGNFRPALDHYQRAFLLGGGVVAAEGIAVAAMRLRDFERARDAAESAIALNPEALASREILAEILFNARSFAAAAPHLEFVSSKRPRDVEILRRLVTCYENTKDREKLAAVDAKIIEIDSKDVRSRQRLAEFALEKNDTRTALRIFRELALLTPTDPRPFKNLYEASLKDGNKKDGMMYLRNFVALDSSDAEAIKLLADLLFEAKDADAALVEYRRALRRNANIKGISKNYATLALEKKIDDEALRVILRAIPLKEADAAMYVAAGDIYMKRNDNANAIRMYQAAMEQDKQNLALLTKLAQAQVAAGDTRNAIVSYEQIVILNPNATAELKVLADLTTRSGKVKEGMDLYKRYLGRVPGDQEISLRVGLHEYANKQFQSAIDFLTKVTDRRHITTEALVALGESYNKIGDCKQAIVYFERVRTATPPPAPAVMGSVLRPLAECYEKEGNKARAADAYAAFTALPNVRDADASYLAAFLREDTDRAGAIRRYEANVRTFPRDHRNFMRLGLLHAADNATLQQAVTNLRTASQLADTVSVIWKTLAEVNGKLKNTDGELSAYTRFLARQPDDITANKRVGTIHIERRQFNTGIPFLEKVVAAKPDDFDAVMMLATGYANTNKHKEAAEQYARAKTLRHDNVAIRLSLIESLEKAGDNNGVRSERRSLAELDRRLASADRRNVESRQRIVMHSLANKDNATAYIFLNELAALTPKDPTVFKNLYDIAIADGKKKEAAGHLKKFIALQPASAEAHKDLGLLLFEEKDFDGALTAFREARRADPRITGIYKPYLTILIQRKINDEIITVGNAAIAAKEADAAIFTAMGDIHRAASRWADAARMYKGALDIDTKNIGLLSLYAECLARSGDLRNAAVTYEQVILMNPRAVNELKELGAIQARQGNNEAAMANYKRYLERNPADEEIALAVGNFEYNKKNFREAIKFYEMVKKAELQNLQYLTRLGDSYFQVENFKKAAEIYDRARRVRNVTPAALRDILRPLAISYERDNQLAKAAEAYAAFIALPGVVDQEASFKRAFLIESSNPAQAIRDYTANIRAFPRDARNFVRLGMLHAKKKETLADAATNLNAAVRLVDNDPDVWLQLARVNGELKRTDPELAAYRRYAQLNPRDLSVTRRIGEIHYEKKQWADAITNLEMFLTTNDKDVKVLLMLVDAYEATNRQQKATELLARAKTLNDKDPDVRERLYHMYKKEGQNVQAENEIRELVAITRNNRHRLMLVSDLIAANKLDEAATVAAEVRRSDPLNFDGLMAVAQIQTRQRRFVEAVETYKMAIFANDKHPMAYVGRGEAHLGLNELDRATSFFRRALELEPRGPSAAAAELGLSRVARAQRNRELQQTHLNRARQLDPNNRQVQEEIRMMQSGQQPAPVTPVAPGQQQAAPSQQDGAPAQQEVAPPTQQKQAPARKQAPQRRQNRRKSN